MSLLLSEGHAEARHYPVAVVWSEARIVRERHSDRRHRDSTVTQLILGSMFGKQAGKLLKETLEQVAESD